jgi:hypothetical protein
MLWQVLVAIRIVKIPGKAHFQTFELYKYALLQCFTTLLALGTTCGFPSLCTALIAVACSQFDKLKAAILDIRQQHISPHDRQEDEHDKAIATFDLQAKLNACIRHHKEIMA